MSGPIRDEDQDKGTRLLIEDLLTKPYSFARDEILRRARRRRYHAYDKNAYDMPEVTLVQHLNAAGFKDLSENVAKGKYDQDAEESRKWAEETEEGRRMVAMAQKDPKMREVLNGIVNAAGKVKIDPASLGKKAPWKGQ